MKMELIISEKFNVDKVYSPKGLQVRKLTTYDGDVDSVSSIYNKISKKEKFTIKGYEFVIKKDLEESNEDGTPKISTQSIYVLDKSVFKKAIEKLIETFVGSDNYKAYLEDTQVKIESTGENIQNVYINEDITVKETKIPVDETIYTDEDTLANYLLYGLNQKSTSYMVKAGDTVESVAFNNKVSPEELLISNETLTSTVNLLYPGQQLKIVETNPQVSVVEESYLVEGYGKSIYDRGTL